MRYHATVHGTAPDYERVFECHVIAENDGAARDKVRTYLVSIGRRQDSKMLIATAKVRDEVATELPLIE